MFQQLTLGGPRLCTVEPCASAQHSLLDADPPAVALGVHPAALQTLICVDLELMANSRDLLASTITLTIYDHTIYDHTNYQRSR